MVHALPDDAWVMLDPSIEILADEVGGYRLLCHGYFDGGMAIPPSEGLLDFITALQGKPVQVSALRRTFDDGQLIDEMTASLLERGFLHETSEALPSDQKLAHLRAVARQTLSRMLRPSVAIDLDGELRLEDLCSRLKACEKAPELLMRCARLSEHKTVLGELASLRQAGTLQIYRAVVQTPELKADGELCLSLIRLGAAVHFEGVRWPTPEHTIPGLTEMTRRCVAVHAVMQPDLSLLDSAVRARVIGWAESACISGLCLQLDADALWPAIDTTDDAFICVFKAVRALVFADSLHQVRSTQSPTVRRREAKYSEAVGHIGFHPRAQLRRSLGVLIR